MDPSAVANMLYCEDNEDLKDIYGPLKLEKAELIILPLNDNSNPHKLSNNQKDIYKLYRCRDTLGIVSILQRECHLYGLKWRRDHECT